MAMPVDVQTEIEIDRPRAVVAAFASDPDNATAWYQNIKSVEWRSPKPLAVGSRITFVAQFLGRTLSYTYEVRDLVPDERFGSTRHRCRSDHRQRCLDVDIETQLSYFNTQLLQPGPTH
jgi:Polyketide cyclase / dehydrase and lipid transport